MASSFLLPIKPEHDYVQAKIYDLKIDTDYLLVVDREIIPNFKNVYYNEGRKIVIYVNVREDLLRKYFSDECIRVELFDYEDADAIIRALKRLFPYAPIYAFVLKKYCRQLKNKFPDVGLLVA